jgi:anti-sigma regulatory factor (Ser/Thr protein kinase)
VTAPLIDEISTELPLGVQAVAIARAFVGDAIRAWGAGAEDIASAELLASELVTNAVLYGYGARTIALRRESHRLRIGVSDSAPGVPTRREAGGEDEIGRGMQLVEAYAESWGVEPHDDGKAVWCEIVIAGG